MFLQIRYPTEKVIASQPSSMSFLAHGTLLVQMRVRVRAGGLHLTGAIARNWNINVGDERWRCLLLDLGDFMSSWKIYWFKKISSPHFLCIVCLPLLLPVHHYYRCFLLDRVVTYPTLVSFLSIALYHHPS